MVVLVPLSMGVSLYFHRKNGDRFLQENPNFVLEDVAPLLPFAAEGPMVTLLPHVYDMDGFFIARLRKERA